MDYAEGMRILRESRLFSPALVPHGGWWHIFSRTTLQCSGETIEAALQAGGFLPRPDDWQPYPQFVAVGANVVQGANTVATCRSNTMASRVANALNEYIPGDRGF
jgi:hypothetical protein